MSSARQIVKGYFHSFLRVLKRHFHAQSENVRGEFEVLVRGCVQIGFCLDPWWGWKDSWARKRQE